MKQLILGIGNTI